MSLQFLAWGSERMPSEVPDVMVRKTKTGYALVCDDLYCPYSDFAKSYDAAEEKEDMHKRWHAEGMPE